MLALIENVGVTRIVCVSDTHTKHENIKVPAGDILIHGRNWSRGEGVMRM